MFPVRYNFSMIRPFEKCDRLLKGFQVPPSPPPTGTTRPCCLFKVKLLLSLCISGFDHQCSWSIYPHSQTKTTLEAKPIEW